MIKLFTTISCIALCCTQSIQAQLNPCGNFTIDSTIIDFTTDGDGYTSSSNLGSTFEDVFNRIDQDLGANTTEDGFYWAVEDIPSSSTEYLYINQIDVTGSDAFSFSIDLLAHDYNDWDVNDSVSISYSVDGGAFQNLLWVRPAELATNSGTAVDIDFDGIGDCPYVLPALSLGTDICTVTSQDFQTFTVPYITLSGNSTLDIKIEFAGLNVGNEGIYLDNIIIEELSISGSIGTDTQVVCDNYTWLNGRAYTSSNNGDLHIMSGAGVSGCDSIVQLDLTINNSAPATTDVISSCTAYTWIDGITYPSSNNSASHLLSTIAGCDSLVFLDLTITPDNVSIQTTLIDFEIAGSRYTPSGTAGTDAFDVFNRINDDLGPNTSEDGYYWAVETIPSSLTNPSIDLDQINVAGAAYFTFSMDLVASDFDTWDNDDEVLVTYSLDGINYQDLMWVQSTNTSTTGSGLNYPSALDLDFDGAGECANVLPALFTGTDNGCTISDSDFETFSTQTILLSGATTLDIKIQFNELDGINEGIFVDNIIVDVATVSGLDVQTACTDYTWIDGQTYTASTNSESFLIVGGAVNGCDSLAWLDLTITGGSAATGIDVISACVSYDWIDGITYTSSNNTATHTIVGGAANGCDSIVTLDLTINTVDVSVTSTDPTLTSSALSATYRWLDCDNNYAFITGETGQSFVASSIGNYAVEVTQNTCVDTSTCFPIVSLSIDDNDELFNNVSIYPNPNSHDDLVNIDLGGLKSVSINVYSVSGKLIYSNEDVNDTSIHTFELTEEAGIYFVKIHSQGLTKQFKLIKM